MKLNNIFLTSLLPAIAALGFSACESDIDPVYVLPADDVTLSGATGDVILSRESTRTCHDNILEWQRTIGTKRLSYPSSCQRRRRDYPAFKR